MALIPKISFPVPANGRGKKFDNPEELLSALYGEGSGLYLVGSQGMWHGGIHITDATVPWCALTGSNESELASVAKPYEGEQAVTCMADGKIVAYRVCDDYDFIEWRGDKVYFSASFVLVEHYIQPGAQSSSGLKFHTLYMNLAPVSAYGQSDVNLRETAKGQKYYSSQGDVNTATASGTLPAGTQVKLGAQVMTSASHHRQFCEVTVVNDTGSLHAGDTVWTVSDRGWLKVQNGQAKSPSWWNKCSPAYVAGNGTQQSFKTATTLKCYLSSEDVSSGNDCGRLANDFPVIVDTALPSFTRVSDHRVFSLVTLGKDNNPLKKGDRVWVVSDNDNLTAEEGASAGQPKYGEVVIPATPLTIHAGDSIGHMGFYELPEENGKLWRYQVHIECLSADSKLPTFLTNPEKVGEDNPTYLSYAEDVELYMPDEQGIMVKSERKSRSPGILALSKVPGVDADGKPLSDNADAAYYQIRPENGWMAKGDVKKVAQFDLAALGFVTLDKTPESFDLIDGIHHPDNVVKGILNELYKAAQNETDSSRKLNQYNYERLLKQIDTNSDGRYSEQEYLQAVHNPSYRDHLYRLIVKHPSEWYYGKDDTYWKVYLDTLAEDPSMAVWKTYTEAFITKMDWMKQVPGMVAKPWHMHPVAFLGALNASELDRCKVLFSKISNVILRHEGGYVNDPNDRGGETNKGITLDTWKAFAPGDLGIQATSQTLKEMTNQQAETIYYNHYWKPKGFCKLENTKIALMIYDWTITSGRAVKQIRKLLHNEYDQGIVVNNTMDDNMIHCINNIDGQEELLNRIADVRRDYYRSLTVTNGEPNSQVRFLTGWLNRVDDCMAVNI